MSVENAASSALSDRYLTMKGDLHGSPLAEALDHDLLDRLGSLDEVNARLWYSLVREQYPDLALSLANYAAEGGTKARILRWLVLQGEDSTATYADLAGLTSTSVRNVKRHVADLRDEDLLHVVDGRPANVVLASPAVYVLGSDTFALYDDAHGLTA